MTGETKVAEERSGTGGQPDEFARLAEASARFMADQAAAMTMMTAFGLTVSGQMAGAFMSAFGGASDTVAPVPEMKEAARQGGSENIVKLREPRKRKQRTADDLKKISGIGPKLEKVLNSMGISTFAEIAKLDMNGMLKIDEKLGLDGRSIRDDWSGQAKALLEG